MHAVNHNPKSLWKAFRPGTSPSSLTTTAVMGKDILFANASDPLTIAVIGCGQRGKAYARYAIEEPSKCKIVAMAEPRPKTRNHFAAAHNIDQTLVFDSWQELHQASAETIKTVGKRLSDAVIIAVQDQMHLEVCLAFAEQGYHILCEKPMSTNLDDCLKIEAAVKKAGIIFGMGHVGYYHFAHSYVRGHWRKEEESCFSLMTKSCHDIDIMSSKPAAAGSATRCLECPMERDCAYSAKKRWPADTIVDGIPDIENMPTHSNLSVRQCVYESDNDVCDNQVFLPQTRLHFAYGEIVGDMSTFTWKQEVLGTDVGDVVKSHLTVFAAERSRREGRVVDCGVFEREARERVAKAQEVS
ncbi:hypothetical protein BC629DRAFT_1514744 [Irpex lacteus]|nr:hypothetical protein BC629DRAFT_1514744 [Irpex lacteus]